MWRIENIREITEDRVGIYTEGTMDTKAEIIKAEAVAMVDRSFATAVINLGMLHQSAQPQNPNIPQGMLAEPPLWEKTD